MAKRVLYKSGGTPTPNPSPTPTDIGPVMTANARWVERWSATPTAGATPTNPAPTNPAPPTQPYNYKGAVYKNYQYGVPGGNQKKQIGMLPKGKPLTPYGPPASLAPVDPSQAYLSVVDVYDDYGNRIGWAYTIPSSGWTSRTYTGTPPVVSGPGGGAGGGAEYTGMSNYGQPAQYGAVGGPYNQKSLGRFGNAPKGAPDMSVEEIQNMIAQTENMLSNFNWDRGSGGGLTGSEGSQASLLNSRKYALLKKRLANLRGSLNAKGGGGVVGDGLSQSRIGQGAILNG